MWLASYPKSGNTMLRAIFSSYFHSPDGNFDFNYLNTIPQFPNNEAYEKIGIDPTDENSVVKNYINVQKIYVKEKNLQFLKTHSLFENKNINFTNKTNTLGAIYVVRDPRNVALSYSHHFDRSIDRSVDLILDENNFLTGRIPIHYIGSWRTNYLSWKKLRDRCYFVKYEDLVKKKKETIIKLFKFIEKLSRQYISKDININVDLKRLDNVIETTSFENMKNLEEKNGFKENPNRNENKKFFNLGINNRWEKRLDFIKKAKIENNFEKEMKELGYL